METGGDKGSREREPHRLNCPTCDAELEAVEAPYAWVYVCEECAVMVLDLKLKFPLWRNENAFIGQADRGNLNP